MRKFKIARMIVLVSIVSISLWGCNGKKEQKDILVHQDEQAKITAIPELLKEDKQGKTVITVDGLEVSYEEVQMYLQSSKEELEALYGEEVWDLTIDAEGTTYEQQLKKSVLEEIIYIKLICSRAESLGMILTEVELLDVDEYTSNYLSNFSKEAQEYYGVNEDIVAGIYKDNLLANKVYENLTLNVDTDVTDEEAKRAIFQYILIGKYGYDQEGERWEYTKEQLEEVKTRASTLQEQALEAASFYNFAAANSDDEDEVEIVVSKGEMKEEIEKVVFELEEGEISEVLDTEDGFFIFYCVSQMDREATDAKKEEIIAVRQKVAFHQAYNEWETSKTVVLNENIWNSIKVKGDIVE